MRKVSKSATIVRFSYSKTVALMNVNPLRDIVNPRGVNGIPPSPWIILDGETSDIVQIILFKHDLVSTARNFMFTALTTAAAAVTFSLVTRTYIGCDSGKGSNPRYRQGNVEDSMKSYSLPNR